MGDPARRLDPIGELFRHGRYVMTWYQMAGDWTTFEIMVKEKWGKLTDDDMTTFSGNSDQLSGLLQHRLLAERRHSTDLPKRAPPQQT